MRSSRTHQAAGVLAACLVLVTACGEPSNVGSEERVQSSDIVGFLRDTTAATELDYDAMLTPEQVVDTADLVITGRLVGVDNGVRIAKSQRSEASDRVARYVAYSVRVDKVLVVRRGFSDAVEAGAASLDLRDDVVDGLGPHERLRFDVPV
jgi:hypothetical protein